MFLKSLETFLKLAVLKKAPRNLPNVKTCRYKHLCSLISIYVLFPQQFPRLRGTKGAYSSHVCGDFFLIKKIKTSQKKYKRRSIKKIYEV